MRSAAAKTGRGAARSVAGSIAAAACTLAIFFGIGVTHPARPPHPQGDSLGMADGETPAQYLTRAAESIGQEPAYALVTFRVPADAVEAARMLAPVDRVSALVVGARAPIVVPEPVDGATRAQVFARFAQERIDGAVVHGTAPQLRTVAGETGVFAVEALPPDAAWGAFTVGQVLTR